MNSGIFKGRILTVIQNYKIKIQIEIYLSLLPTSKYLKRYNIIDYKLMTVLLIIIHLTQNSIIVKR